VPEDNRIGGERCGERVGDALLAHKRSFNIDCVLTSSRSEAGSIICKQIALK
jgi:hypothetical protein